MTGPHHPADQPQAPTSPNGDRPPVRPATAAGTPAKAPVTPAKPRVTPAKPPATADTPAEPTATADTSAKPLSPALDKTFKIGLVLKGLDGVLEVVGGILLLFLTPQAIQHIVRALTAHELSEDPHDMIARYLLHTTAHLHHGTTLFGAIYLLIHGVAKIVLVALVLRGKLWAYPITAVHFSAGLTALTVFDALLVWLTWREYRSKRGMAKQDKAPVAAPSPGGHRPTRPQPGQGT